MSNPQYFCDGETKKGHKSLPCKVRCVKYLKFLVLGRKCKTSLCLQKDILSTKLVFTSSLTLPLLLSGKVWQKQDSTDLRGPDPHGHSRPVYQPVSLVPDLNGWWLTVLPEQWPFTGLSTRLTVTVVQQSSVTRSPFNVRAPSGDRGRTPARVTDLKTVKGRLSVGRDLRHLLPTPTKDFVRIVG